VTDFNFSGFEVTPADWERFVNDSLSWLGQFDMVCVSGSLPSGVSPEAFTDWMVRLRSQCPCIIFDSSREALVAGLKAAPWLVKPNRRELEIWAGRKLPEMKDVIDAAHALREQGIAHVVISLAKRVRCGLTPRANGLPNRLQWKWSAPLAPGIPWLAA
jgi:1-phosphofructokinase